MTIGTRHREMGPIAEDNMSQEAYIRNGLYHLGKLKSYLHEVLTSPSDQHVKDNLLEQVTEAELNLRKAIL